MENKFNLTREQNIFVAKRNIVDYIWKSANLEGIGVTYPETQAIYDGGIVNRKPGSKEHEAFRRGSGKCPRNRSDRQSGCGNLRE